MTIDDLLVGVEVALGKQSDDVCPHLDADRSQQVDVSDLIRAVRDAIDGC